MAPILIDTTVLIDVLRGRPAAQRLRRLLDAGDDPYACAVNVEETVRGLPPEQEAPAGNLFQGLREAPLGLEQGWQAGAWRRAFASRGVTLSQADCLVAASAVAIGGRLVTGNPRDFPMGELAVEHWPVGLQRRPQSAPRVIMVGPYGERPACTSPPDLSGPTTTKPGGGG